jgi:acetylglutamate kinase
VDALGLSGVDRGLIRCRKRVHPSTDLGFVGEIVEIRAEVIHQLVALGITPVVSPISLGIGPDSGQVFNVNADEAAAELARAVHADQLDFVSDVPGVLHQGIALALLTPQQARSLMDQRIITDGMVPKVGAALAAVKRGVPRARIVDLAGLNSAESGGTWFVSEVVA